MTDITNVGATVLGRPRLMMKLPRILIGGTGSDCGKTTVTLALLRALMDRGLTVAAFKCGPDYIDPMFHSRVTGTKSRNLDAFLCGRENVTRLLAKNSAGADIAVIEGVMGYYDGLSALNDENSAADISRLTATPSVLVVNPRGTSLSVAALIHGFASFRENTLKAVILNGVSGAMSAYYRGIIERETDVSVLGALPNIPEASIESRHLGLITAGEIADLQAKTALLARAAADNIDIDALIALAGTAGDIEEDAKTAVPAQRVRIAVSEDSAFNFIYADSLDTLSELGAEIVPFSPLSDNALPDNADGLILCGGYPELHLEALSANTAMLESIRNAINGGLPAIAECGGFMYLHESVEGFRMAGIIRGEAHMTKRLGRFGYFHMTAKTDSLLCRAGEQIPVHEFHYSRSADEGADFTLTKPAGGTGCATGYASETLYAGYPHIHFSGCTEAARRFLRKCAEYGARA